MPDGVAADDNGADPADPHDQDDTTPFSSPDWNVRQALTWIIWRRPPSVELLKLLDTASDEDDAEPADKDLAKQIATALDEMNHAAMAGRLPVRARQSDKLWPPPARPTRKCIPANVIDEVRRIGIDGWCRIHAPDLDEVLHDRGPYFYDVCFRAADVKKLWPVPSTDAVPAAPARSAPTATPPDKTQDAYQACVGCLRAIIEASPSYRTHKRSELRALCGGALKEQAWRDALKEAIPEDHAWNKTGRRKQR
jgi:hypothetical protein